MYYPERLAGLILVAAILYVPPSSALATGYTHVRVLSASVGQDRISITFWIDSDLNLRVSGDINADIGLAPAGVGVITLHAHPSRPILRICFETNGLGDCGIIRPIPVS